MTNTAQIGANPINSFFLLLVVLIIRPAVPGRSS